MNEPIRQRRNEILKYKLQRNEDGHWRIAVPFLKIFFAIITHYEGYYDGGEYRQTWYTSREEACKAIGQHNLAVRAKKRSTTWTDEGTCV